MKNISLPVAPGCLQCEALPEGITGPGILHLRFPLTHSRAKVKHYFQQSTLPFTEDGDRFSIELAAEDLMPSVLPLLQVLSSIERQDVRVLFEPQGRELEMNDFFNVESLTTFTARLQSPWLLQMLGSHNLTSVFQPIMSCHKDAGQENPAIFAYECLMRGCDENGEIVFPDRILDVARGAGLLFQLDRMARLSAIREAARFQLMTKIFINFIPTTIYDPVNCLRSTMKAVDNASLQREQVVFEVVESELVHDVAHLKKILDFYRASGFEVALDDVGSGYSSLNLLSALRPDYIKLDRELTSDLHNNPFKATIAQKMIEAAQELNIKTVAEGVETAADFQWLQEKGADFAQGYFFARPASPPPLLQNSW